MGPEDGVVTDDDMVVIATDAPDGAVLFAPIAEAHGGSVYEQKGLDGDPFPWVLAVPATVAAVTALRDVVIAILQARCAAKATVGRYSITGVGPEDIHAFVTLLVEQGLIEPDQGSPDDGDSDPGTVPEGRS